MLSMSTAGHHRSLKQYDLKKKDQTDVIIRVSFTAGCQGDKGVGVISFRPVQPAFILDTRNLFRIIIL